MFFGRKKDEPPQPDLANLKITDAQVGDTLSISGAAEDFSDIDFTIDRCDAYEAGTRQWVEMSGNWRDKRVRLEVHGGDTVEVLGSFDGQTLTLDELGLTEDDLTEIDDRQNPSDFFDYGGKFWLYRFSREVGVFTAGNATGSGLYLWQFQEQSGNRFMSIRKFQSEPFAATIWVKVEPTDITVFRS